MNLHLNDATLNEKKTEMNKTETDDNITENTASNVDVDDADDDGDVGH